MSDRRSAWVGRAPRPRSWSRHRRRASARHQSALSRQAVRWPWRWRSDRRSADDRGCAS